MFKIGDKVVVVDAQSVGDYYKNGDIGVVSEINGKLHGYVTREDGVRMNVYWDEVKLYKEPQEAFKVGDRVKFKKSSLAAGMIDAKETDVFTIVSIPLPSDKQQLVWIEERYGWYHVSHFEHVKDSVMTETGDAMNNTGEQEIEWEGSQIDWQVGQEVWDVRNGRGIVKSTEYEGGYPIFVEFDLKEFGGENVADCYTLDGRYGKTQTLRSLFFSEPKIIAEKYPPKKPFVPKLKNGDVIFVKVKDELYGEGTVRTVHSEIDDRIYISENHHYFLKKDILSIRVLSEEIIFN